MGKFIEITEAARHIVERDKDGNPTKVEFREGNPVLYTIEAIVGVTRHREINPGTGQPYAVIELAGGEHPFRACMETYEEIRDKLVSN